MPIEDENEMGISIVKLIKRLNQDADYSRLFRDAFGQVPNGYNIPRALSSYIRTLISFDSPYDHFISGDSTAMTTSQIRGKDLFYSDRLNCNSCHTGVHFTNQGFENNGLYESYSDLGRALITLDKKDVGKFRVPSLRNVAMTAPYMHDGSITSLHDVTDHYQNGLSHHANQSPLLKSFSLREMERADLVSFLEALTGEAAQTAAY